MFDASYGLQITHLMMTPSIFDLVVNCELPSVVNIALGGERVMQHQLEMWRDRVKHFVTMYGPTETTFSCTAMEFDKST
ncbi:MAG: AMP-binding protein, partial [Alphaproteobacteria bacterium]|nr:AMP-binding protein [Alphaproteobacteria bacterium]